MFQNDMFIELDFQAYTDLQLAPVNFNWGCSVGSVTKFRVRLVPSAVIFDWINLFMAEDAHPSCFRMAVVSALGMS